MNEGSNQMSEHKENRIFRRPAKPSKKVLVAAVCILCLAAACCLLVFSGVGGSVFGSGNVSFTPLSENEIPRAIEKDVIPEYRELERALACVADEKIYIVVTRGEKPTSGYDISIEKVKLEKTESGSNLVVTAMFTDPPQGKSEARIITYPYAVAVTDLKGLPDTIELIARYAQQRDG